MFARHQLFSSVSVFVVVDIVWEYDVVFKGDIACSSCVTFDSFSSVGDVLKFQVDVPA